MQTFLNYGQYANLHNTLLKRFKTLSSMLNTISVNDVIYTLGFPNDWHIFTDKIDQNIV